jgi:hypothetical protein
MDLGKCTICRKSTKNKCSRCKSAAYCSRRCQKLDLPLHKLLCSKYQDFLKTRPDPTDLDESGDKASAEYEKHAEDDGDETSDEVTKRLPPVSIAALLFPVDADYPQLIWLKCKNWIEYGELVTIFKGSMKKYAGQLLWPTRNTQNRANIELWMEQEFDRSPANQCLSMLNAGYGTGELDLFFPTRYPTGSIIVVNYRWGITDGRAKELEAGCEYHDVALSDLRYAFTYLTRPNALFESDKQNPYYIRQRGHWLKGVKMYPGGEVKNDGKKKFQDVEVSRLHSIFRGGGRISSITQKMGFPLLMKASGVDERWQKQWEEKSISDTERGSDPWEHPEVRHLMVITDMESELYGSVDRDSGPSIGPSTGPITPIVVRKDMEDLTANQLEAVVSYSRKNLMPKMREIVEAAEEACYDVTKQRMTEFSQEYLSGEKFDRFFSKLKANKLEEGDESWADDVSPRPQPVVDPATTAKKEEVEEDIKMEDIELEMEDIAMADMT